MKLNNIFERYSISNIKESINKYGYRYTSKDILFQFFGIVVSIIVVGIISKLEYNYILVLVFIGIILAPIVLVSIFKSIHSVKRFTILCDYLTNIIPIFLQKTKIRYTLAELYDLSAYDMKSAIKEAIEYMDTSKNDINLYKNSLAIIEKKFNNSRLNAVHKLLINVENNNSVNFKDIANDMVIDIENWIKRTYSFQKELKNRKTKLLLLCLLILFMNSIFIALYNSNVYFTGFTDNALYQLSSTIFISIIMIIATIILVKLNGNWLIEDVDKHNDDLKRLFYIYKNSKTNNLVFILCTIIFMIIGVLFYIYNNELIAFVSILFAILIFIKKNSKIDNAYKKINKHIMYEFPKWLRDVCLKVNDMNVINAIESTIQDVSYPLKIEIKKFLKSSKSNPTSIKPYNDFLSEYKLDDANNSMKVLYSINNVSKDEIRNRVSSLIVRNQELLDTVEKLENDDEIIGVEAIAYLPTLIFCVQMIISMFLMFSYMMNNIQGAILF